MLLTLRWHYAFAQKHHAADAALALRFRAKHHAADAALALRFRAKHHAADAALALRFRAKHHAADAALALRFRAKTSVGPKPPANVTESKRSSLCLHKADSRCNYAEA